MLLRLPLTGLRPSALALLVAAGCSDGDPPERAEPDARATDAGATDAPGPPRDVALKDSGGPTATAPGEGGADVVVIDAPSEPGAPEAGSDSAMADRLRDTGLYADPATEELAGGVRPYRARYELWSDGATKRRFLYLPPGAMIDTTDMDQWQFPVGTKAWKEFTRDGVRVETRLFEKTGSGPTGWDFVAYVWNEAQTEAIAAPAGASDALGTEHDVPNQTDCFGCHAGSADLLLGVSAIQLSHDTTGLSAAEIDALGLTLGDLVSEGRLSVPPPTDRFEPPGDAVDRAALGVLHANCGHCHRPGTLAWERAEMDLHLSVLALAQVVDTGAYQTAVAQPTAAILEGVSLRIAPGDPSMSAVYVRMTQRSDPLLAMPPIASELVDVDGARAVADWITGLM